MRFLMCNKFNFKIQIFFLPKVHRVCYNIYDFGTELFEFNFDEDMGRARRAMVLNIPRGMLFTLRVDLGKEAQ